MKELRGKVILVTGGASGIGEAAATQLGEYGASVVVADRNLAGAEKVSAELNSHGVAEAIAVEVEVSDEESVRDLVAAAVDTFGRLDGAINCAGVPPAGQPVFELDLDAFERAYLVNLRGMFLSLKYEIPAIRQAGGGAVVAISSTAAVRGLPFSPEYCATKSGVNGLVRAAAIDCAGSGVRVNGLMPDGTLTPMMLAAIERMPALEDPANMPPIQRWARPEEVASAAVWLVSDQASYVHGATIPIDGARTIF
ncbi:SDR family NAD(P)-dependent oxidoreductase [Nocardia pseudovaccinii]|uniref:SDR family NAD(P)-dependent oxidoreductase n=1 Tax=Nocardia pseudovaccinii TaxID=189540 RepID=UPI0007A41FBE|nr:SDR family oxidoreductase [Nocardia pseudovaccinii]